MYDNNTVEMFVSDCGKYRARVVYETDALALHPLHDWEHGVTVIPVGVSRDYSADDYAVNDHTERAALMRHLLDRMDEMPGAFLTAEERGEHVGAWFEDVTRGGLINEPADAVEVFERLTGVEVTHRTVTGVMQGDQIEVVAFAAEADPAAPSAVLDTLGEWLRGEVYGIILEKRETWVRRSDDEEVESWDEIESSWGYIGNDHALEVAQDELRHAVRAAA